MYLPSQDISALPNPLKEWSLPSIGQNGEAKKTSYQAGLQRKKWEQVSPSYVSTLTSSLSH